MSDYLAGLRRLVGHDLLMLPGVSGVVLNDAGEVLLGQRADFGQWSLPAGTVDPGEQPAEALLREVAEETGVVAAIERLAGVALHPVTYPNGDCCEYVNMWFRCRAVGGRAHAADDESLAAGWFPVDALPEVTEWVRLRIRTALAEGEAAWFARPGEWHAGLSDPTAA